MAEIFNSFKSSKLFHPWKHGCGKNYTISDLLEVSAKLCSAKMYVFHRFLFTLVEGFRHYSHSFLKKINVVLRTSPRI